MTESDPVRLRAQGSQAPDELRRALEEARDVPAERLARVAERLGAAGPGPGSGSGPTAPRMRTIGMVGAAVVAVGIGLGAWQLLGSRRDSVPASSRRTSAPSAEPVRHPSEVSPAVAPPHSPPPTAASAPVVDPPRSGPRVPVPAESEAQLLLRARRALAVDASRALGLVREHARRFPEGELAEEREALRIEALVASGRTDEARRALAQFRGRFAGSAHLEHLSQLISAGAP